MQAMRLEELGPIEGSPLRLTHLPDPWPEPNEVRIRVSYCAICRTDLHVIEGDLPKKGLPLVPGHQAVGVIDMVGRDCRKFSVGQRVGVAWLRYVCGTCLYCQSGQENLCDVAKFTGYHADGGFAEYCVAPENFVYAIPEIFSGPEAAPLLCAGIIGYRALKRAELIKGGTLGLFGFGSSAHVVLQLARARGCRVYVVTRGEKHRELAKKLGADWVGESPFDLPRKLDSAILFAPAGDLVPPILASLRKGGTLALAGIYLTDIPVLQYERHLFYEKTIRSVTSNTRQDGLELLAEAAAIPIKPEVTLYPFAEANRALQDLKADRIKGSAVLAFR